MTSDPSNHAETDGASRGEGWVVAQLALFAAIALVPPDLGGLPPWPAPLARVGLVGALASGSLGAGIAGLALLNLGPNLTIFPRPKSDGALVQSGVYTLVRHPIYCGVILCALTWSLLRASTPALLLTLVLVLFFDRKAAREEQWLLQKYPAYRDYCRRVRKLIPWVY